jgi:hypothetical protein
MQYDYKMTGKVDWEVNAQPDGLRAKIKAYLEILKIKGHSIGLPYADKIEGYKNLHELRPHFHNIEFRMIYFWDNNSALFINTFFERGKKKENRREYETANQIRNEIVKRR